MFILLLFLIFYRLENFQGKKFKKKSAYRVGEIKVNVDSFKKS